MYSNEKPIVCLITGPAGAGKSSVSIELAKKFNKSAVIEVDKIGAMVVGGHVKPWPQSDEADLQLSLRVKNACDMATNFLEKGFNVIIDDVVGRKLLEQYSTYFSEENYRTFLLLPSIESLLKRFDSRGRNDKLRERTIELHSKFLERRNELSWKVIDSGDQTLEETTEQIYLELKN